MSKPAIEVKNLGKVYNIGHEQKASVGNVTLVDTLSGIVRKPVELITGHRLQKEKFWALDDVSFEINQGDVVGIIGRNGSGKSTLLKILSRIVEPTEGEIVMRGKVASLLEVGTGFHPELTGRENIYFNGAILGMKQSEIRAKFDEIVAFSEVEKFLDTPVKFYSSGMYVRLAFSVAAHLEPDILIVDEVLAVGDAAFQKKCLGKMKDVAGEGRTVLFVSHQQSAISSLCNKAILMKQGKLIVGPTSVQEAFDKYLLDSQDNSGSYSRPRDSRLSAQITSVDIKNQYIEHGDMIEVDIVWHVNEPNKSMVLSYELTSSEGSPLASATDADNKQENLNKQKGEYSAKVKISTDVLLGKDYTLTFSIQDPQKAYIDQTDQLAFHISRLQGKTPSSSLTNFGYVNLETLWDIKALH